MDGERDPLLPCLKKLSPGEEAEMRRRVIQDLQRRMEVWALERLAENVQAAPGKPDEGI